MSALAVAVQELEPGIVQLTLQDRTNKNTFAPALIDGLERGFAAVRADPACKVVILTGYDSYFLSGGTQEALLTLADGNGRFSDGGLYAMPLECEVPVIAAMQGHGIGGGFVFGLFADLVVLGRESVYTTNFMRYGFTPGMGATCVVPKKLGMALAQEMLLGARNYRGAELERRGVPFPVLPRAEVLPYALQLARELAEKPRVSLIALKRHLVADLRRELPAIIEQELAMHEQTFHLPEVRARISTRFGQ